MVGFAALDPVTQALLHPVDVVVGDLALEPVGLGLGRLQHPGVVTGQLVGHPFKARVLPALDASDEPSHVREAERLERFRLFLQGKFPDNKEERQAYERVAQKFEMFLLGRELPFENLHVTPVAGLEGIKEAEITIEGTVPEWSFLEGVTAKVAVAHSLANARARVEQIRAGEASYHFVEVMTCPGGCIGGGGQPRITNDEVREKRIKAIYAEDEGKTLRKSHNNEQVAQLYAEFLGAPLGHKSHELLHTHYFEKERI